MNLRPALLDQILHEWRSLDKVNLCLKKCYWVLQRAEQLQSSLHLSLHGQDGLLCTVKLKYQVGSSCAGMRTIPEGCQDIWGWGAAAFPPGRIDNSLQVFIGCLHMHLSVSVPRDGGFYISLPLISTSWEGHTMLLYRLTAHRSSLHAGREGTQWSTHLRRGLEHHVCPEESHAELPDPVGLLAHCSDRHCMGVRSI